jgi:hypothetical protein
MVTSKSAEVGDGILKVTFCFILMEEIWKDIKGYEGLYQVSNLGMVKSLGFDKWHKGRILKQSFDSKRNYLFVGLHKDGKIKQKNVHRLVAETFIPNPDNLPCVNHINEIKTDNRACNLEFCTVKYNSNYGNAKKNMIESRRKNNDQEEINRKIKETKRKNGSYSCEKPVAQYTLGGDLVNIYASATDAERKTGISRGGIQRCCIGKYLQAKGYIWKYI